MEQRYKNGATVYAKENPGLKLIIRRYIDRIYFCKIKDAPEQKEKAYFEREIDEEL